jgi:hypothetical protein
LSSIDARREWFCLEIGAYLENLTVEIVEEERRGRSFVGK